MKELLFALTLANAGDLASTEYALSRPDLIAVEGNVLMQHRTARVSLKSGATAIEVWGLRKMHATHPKVAKGVAIGLTAFNGYLAVHNLRMVQQARGQR